MLGFMEGLLALPSCERLNTKFQHSQGYMGYSGCHEIRVREA